MRSEASWIFLSESFLSKENFLSKIRGHEYYDNGSGLLRQIQSRQYRIPCSCQSMIYFLHRLRPSQQYTLIQIDAGVPSQIRSDFCFHGLCSSKTRRPYEEWVKGSRFFLLRPESWPSRISSLIDLMSGWIRGNVWWVINHGTGHCRWFQGCIEPWNNWEDIRSRYEEDVLSFRFDKGQLYGISEIHMTPAAFFTYATWDDIFGKLPKLSLIPLQRKKSISGHSDQCFKTASVFQHRVI